VVVGAGMAGLSCAQQLKYFGFEVKVIEARSRVGGRVYSPLMSSRSEFSSSTQVLFDPHIIMDCPIVVMGI